MLKLDPALAAVAALHESRTAPDKEDWTLLPLGEGQLFVMAYQEDAKKNVFCQAGESTVADMKNLVCNLSPDHRLGAVILIITTDYEECGGVELSTWLLKKAREKNFSLSSIISGKATARQAHERALALLAENGVVKTKG